MTSEPRNALFPLPDNWHIHAVEKLNSLIIGGGDCPACGPLGKGRVIANGQIVTPIAITEAGSLALGSDVVAYPQLTLVCSRCGFTRHFNYAILMGDAREADAS